MEINNDLLDIARHLADKTPPEKFIKPLVPDTVVLHYTAGSSAESAINSFLQPDFGGCAHLVVARDGAITQMVPFNRQTWHAGRSRHLDRVGLNAYSIGIEIVNAGRLKKVGRKYTSWFSHTYDEEDVFVGIHRNENVPTYWHRYTEEQISTVTELCQTLRLKYGIQHILGHEEISPQRKIDPGPAFPLEKIRQRILNPNARSEDSEPMAQGVHWSGLVSASSLNVRSGPASFHAKVMQPLTAGSRVVVLSEKNGWLEVKVEVEGWVSADFVKPDES